MATHGFLVYPASLNSGGGLQVGAFLKESFVRDMTDERWKEILDACTTASDPNQTTTFFRDGKGVALVGRLVPKELEVVRQALALKDELAGVGITLVPLPLPTAEDVRRVLDPSSG